MLKITDILKRVGDVVSSHQNKDIAAALGVAETTCSTWKKRNSIPSLELISFAQKHNLSLDWLFLGVQKSDHAYAQKIQKECDKVAKILTSDYDHIKDELIYYLNKLTTDCEMADRNAKRLRRLEDQNKEMRQELRELRKRERLGYSPVREGPARRGAKKEG